jgi:predicted HicB family RNase H-like nuclease
MATRQVTAINAAHYTFRVAWSPEDEEFVATCLELPSLSWLARDPAKALVGLQKVVADAVADMIASGEDVPEPLSERHYSGRFNVRMSPDLHRCLVVEATERRMSLNRFVTERLSSTR